MPKHLNDYLALEAGEYLGQLEELLNEAGQPDLQEFQRLVRGVRGSAQMAGADLIAGVAERLESAVSALAKNELAWSDAVRRMSLRTVDDLKVLVRTPDRRGPDEERRAQDAITRWDAQGDAPEPSAGTEEVVVPISTLFYDDEGPHIVSSPSSTMPPAAAQELADDGVVPIESLLLRGDRALEKALSLRSQIEARIVAGDAGDALRAHIDEVFDLVELGRSTEPQSS